MEQFLSLVAKLAAMLRPSLTWKFFPSRRAETPSLSLSGLNAQIRITYILSFLSCRPSVSLLVSPNFTYLVTCSQPLSAYWNEARILDPATFDTVQELPNIPGDVDNCKAFLSTRRIVTNISTTVLGGRTYPLEGKLIYLISYTYPNGFHVLQVPLCSSPNMRHTQILSGY